MVRTLTIMWELIPVDTLKFFSHTDEADCLLLVFMYRIALPYMKGFELRIFFCSVAVHHPFGSVW